MTIHIHLVQVTLVVTAPNGGLFITQSKGEALAAEDLRTPSPWEVLLAWTPSHQLQQEALCTTCPGSSRPHVTRPPTGPVGLAGGSRAIRGHPRVLVTCRESSPPRPPEYCSLQQLAPEEQDPRCPALSLHTLPGSGLPAGGLHVSRNRSHPH